ncbi:hypothetical protein [Fibrobacter sp. UWEL]|uniref:hypothetical protein n=1 Tax=Fibrobacter sp. UWEL TaxID=1896209 RepID=UPI00090F6C7B|nr:hypothetical protein [Fibrobacter sp. UWEL]SHK99950.1 hypothetical protein SAMN05720468_11132 [Fibrobacter sp. UWEL]
MAGIFNNKCFRVGRLGCLAFALLLGVGCSGEVVVDQKLVDTFVELRLMDMAYGGDSPMARLSRQDILKKAGYTREQYLDEVNKILDDPDQWIPFQKAVNDRIDTLLAVRKEMEQAKPSVPKSGPSAPAMKPAPNTPPRTRKGVIEGD